MIFTIEDFMKNAFVLTCNEQRLNKFYERMINAGFDKNNLPKAFCGIAPKYLNITGGRGCTLGHFNLINMAKTLDYPYITVFEDDAYPCIDCYNKIKSLMEKNEIPDDADIISVGQFVFVYWNNSPYYAEYESINDMYFKLGFYGLGGSQTMIYLKHGYDKYLNIQRNANKFIAADGMTDDTHSKGILNKYATKQSFFFQRDLNNKIPRGLFVDWKNLSLFP